MRSRSVVVGRDAGHLLLPREEAEAGLAPRRGEGEGVERLEAEEQRHGAAVHLRPHRARPRPRRRPTRSSSRFHDVGSLLFWVSANVTGRSIAADRRRIQSISRSGAARSSPSAPAGASSNTPVPSSPSTRPMPNSSSSAANVPGTGSPSMARWASVRLVEKPSAPASMPSPDDGGHRLDVLGRWPARCARPARPSRSRAPRRGAPGCRCPSRSERASSTSRNSGKLSQPHWMPALQRGAGDVLHALHQADEPLVAIRGHRREADAAVAHHDGGDAVPAARRELLVPRGLAVVVRVDVDEARASRARRRRRSPRCRARRPGPPR